MDSFIHSFILSSSTWRRARRVEARCTPPTPPAYLELAAGLWEHLKAESEVTPPIIPKIKLHHLPHNWSIHYISEKVQVAIR